MFFKKTCNFSWNEMKWVTFSQNDHVAFSSSQEIILVWWLKTFDGNWRLWEVLKQFCGLSIGVNHRKHIRGAKGHQGCGTYSDVSLQL